MIGFPAAGSRWFFCIKVPGNIPAIVVHGVMEDIKKDRCFCLFTQSRTVCDRVEPVIVLDHNLTADGRIKVPVPLQAHYLIDVDSPA